MKEKDQIKTFNKNLLIGAITSITSLISFVLCWILTYVLDLNNLKESWYIFLILGIALILFIISMILLKKGNKQKLDYLRKKQDEEFNKKMEEYLKKKNENKD